MKPARAAVVRPCHHPSGPEQHSGDSRAGRTVQIGKREATISSVNVGRLVDLIRVVARRQPDAPAIEFEGTTQTYRETYEAALRLASGLRHSDLQPGDAIGILAGNSPAYLEIYLA